LVAQFLPKARQRRELEHKVQNVVTNSRVHEHDDPPVVDLAKHKLVCYSELGGHLKSYRAAA
jgi:hypothetical protein